MRVEALGIPKTRQALDHASSSPIVPPCKGVAGACQRTILASRLARVRCRPFLPTMTLNSTSDSCSVFEDGKLKPGIYKIQNVYTETYLDIDVYSRVVCCRPAHDLGEKRGLVSRYP